MNIILFEAEEIGRPLSRGDGRARHLLAVLKRVVGGEFDAGIVDGPRGKGTLRSIGGETLEWVFEPGKAPPPLDPIRLIIGLPRPQTARKILSEGASMGVEEICFVASEKGERSYGQSVLWSSGEWRRHVRAGVEQAFSTRIPTVKFGLSLMDALGSLPPSATAIALDNYESAKSIQDVPIALPPVAIVVGSERGWSAAERDVLRQRRATLAHLGGRVLRTETVCVAAVAIVKARLGLFDPAP